MDFEKKNDGAASSGETRTSSTENAAVGMTLKLYARPDSAAAGRDGACAATRPEQSHSYRIT